MIRASLVARYRPKDELEVSIPVENGETTTAGTAPVVVGCKLFGEAAMHLDENFALYERIYDVVEQIPAGQVSTYGDVAQVVGGGCDGRTVGYALGAMGPSRTASVPWQRVVNREGGISTKGQQQRDLLEAEGVPFDAAERVILARCRWSGPDAAWAAAQRFQTLPEREEGEQLSLL